MGNCSDTLKPIDQKTEPTLKIPLIRMTRFAQDSGAPRVDVNCLLKLLGRKKELEREIATRFPTPESRGLGTGYGWAMIRLEGIDSAIEDMKSRLPLNWQGVLDSPEAVNVLAGVEQWRCSDVRLQNRVSINRESTIQDCLMRRSGSGSSCRSHAMVVRHGVLIEGVGQTDQDAIADLNDQYFGRRQNLDVRK